MDDKNLDEEPLAASAEIVNDEGASASYWGKEFIEEMRQLVKSQS